VNSPGANYGGLLPDQSFSLLERGACLTDRAIGDQ
jgi:hypothetical protein